MKRKLFLLGILAAGFFAFMPAKTNAGCCEYFERTAGVFCLDGTSQQYCDDIEEKTNKDKAMVDNNLHIDGKYYAKKECAVPGEWKNKCVCPNGKNCLELQIPFPGSSTIEDAAYNQQFSDIIAKYIIRIFQFGIWIAISLAIFMIMLAGFIWLISAGNMGLIGKAKGYITNALYGLIIALLAFIMLQTINPKLVELKMPTLNSPTTFSKEDKCCFYSKTTNKAESMSPMGEQKDNKGKIITPAQTCNELLTERKKLNPSLEMCSIKNCCVCQRKTLPRAAADFLNGGPIHDYICYTNLSEYECTFKSTAGNSGSETGYNIQCHYSTSAEECLNKRIYLTYDCQEPGNWTYGNVNPQDY